MSSPKSRKVRTAAPQQALLAALERDRTVAEIGEAFHFLLTQQAATQGKDLADGEIRLKVGPGFSAVCSVFRFETESLWRACRLLAWSFVRQREGKPLVGARLTFGPRARKPPFFLA
jgi:hypothetical protein